MQMPEHEDFDDYDVFLDTWEPSELLQHSTLRPYLYDPMSRERLFSDLSGVGGVTRTPFMQGLKVMEAGEANLRRHKFFEENHSEWSKHFREDVLSNGIDRPSFDAFVSGFAELWIDGRSRRQDSRVMMGIKASIRDYDRRHHRSVAGKFVVNSINDSIAPMFTPDQMGAIFSANERLLETYIPSYMDVLGCDVLQSINNLYVRRGVCMPSIERFRKELHYLSSYSLALGPVEQFAQTWTDATRNTGVPSIFAAPLPAVQKRVVAFAPFIEGMDLSQLELVVAPPIEPTPLENHGQHGGIYEFSFE